METDSELYQITDTLTDKPSVLYDGPERPLEFEIEQERLREELQKARTLSRKERTEDYQKVGFSPKLIQERFLPTEWRGTIAAKDWETVAEMGRRDMFGFAFCILGYDKLQEDIHRDWCDWATNFSFTRKLRMEPRETYKSTVLTISFSLWLLLQDGEIVRGVSGKNLRILIANSVGARATDFGREIEGHVLRNPIFQACYGELVDWSRWNASQKDFNTRTLRRKEPSLQFTGKGSQLTSAHYDIAIFDDLVNEKDRDSKTERDATLRWWQDVFSLVHPDGLFIVMGTRWHYHDLYSHILDEQNDMLKAIGEEPFHAVIESCYLEDGKTARFPTILDEKKLERLKIEKGAQFPPQYLNKAMSPEQQLFKEDNLLFFEDYDLYKNPKALEYYICGDPSLGRSVTSDFSAVLVLARNIITGDLYLVEADLERRSTDAFKQRFIDLMKRFHPIRKVGFETNGFQVETANELQRMIAADKGVENTRIIHIQNTGNKIERIKAAESKVRIVRFSTDWRRRYREFMEELFTFPLGDFDDGPDCLEMLLSHLTNVTTEDVRSALRANAYEAAGKSLGSQVLNAKF